MCFSGLSRMPLAKMPGGLLAGGSSGEGGEKAQKILSSFHHPCFQQWCDVDKAQVTEEIWQTLVG